MDRTQALIDEALRLPPEDRARIAAELIASVDGEPEPDAEAAWVREIEQRARRALASPEGGADWETVRRQVEDHLRHGPSHPD